MHDKVTQLRQLLAESMPRRPATPERRALAAFQHYQYNGGLPPIEQSPRARAEREIQRIALTYGWQGAVVRALDDAGATELAGLDDQLLDGLARQMREYVDRAMTACDFDEAPPAR